MLSSGAVRCLVVVLVAWLAATPIAYARPSFEVREGALEIRDDGVPLMTEAKLRLQLANEAVVTGVLWLDETRRGPRGSRSWVESRYRLASSEPLGGFFPRVTLVLRQYERPDALVVTVESPDVALAAENGVEFRFKLPAFRRGLAFHRYKACWTAPVVTADYRQLPASNVMLLWRRGGHPGMHLLAPLVGGGHVAEVGAQDYAFRVSASRHAPAGADRRPVPLFALSSGRDAHALPRAVYTVAFDATQPYGRLRWEKEFPLELAGLGWCSWNTYYEKVTASQVLASVRSLRKKGVPVSFVLVDDGWLTVEKTGPPGLRPRLRGYGADPARFPEGLAGLVDTLRKEHGILNVGVWRTLHGYWGGVDPSSDVGRTHALAPGPGGRAWPDPSPRDPSGTPSALSFFTDWDHLLWGEGIRFLKVDNQAGTLAFSDRQVALADATRGLQQALQESALRALHHPSGIINCMSMSLDNAFAWHSSNVTRASDDYMPDDRLDSQEHVLYSAYNAYWLSSFAWPDYDMFQTHGADAEYQAMARAISGGPVYTTDAVGSEKASVLRRLALDDATVLRPDAPAQVVAEQLLRDPSLERVPLLLSAPVRRPGMAATVVGAFHVNKASATVTGRIIVPRGPVAVYRRGDRRASLISAAGSVPVQLHGLGSDLFTMVPVQAGTAVFGLLDKYIGPAAVCGVERSAGSLVVYLRQAGDLGLWTTARPRRVRVDGKVARGWTWRNHLLVVPLSAFTVARGDRRVEVWF